MRAVLQCLCGVLLSMGAVLPFVGAVLRHFGGQPLSTQEVRSKLSKMSSLHGHKV